MRFTIGQIPSHCSASPASTSAPPAATNPLRVSSRGRTLLSHWPVQRPSIIVASVGMKLSVDHPPLLKRKGDSRGNILRNQTSNAHDRFEFLLKCARKPE